jgi:hypothetical protein
VIRGDAVKLSHKYRKASKRWEQMQVVAVNKTALREAPLHQTCCSRQAA